MTSQDQQNNIIRIKDKLSTGLITVAEANVEMVRCARYRLISSTVDRDTRKYLNDAVKAGKLGHMKKDGSRPEVYYHPDFEFMANGARAEHYYKTLEALKRVCI